MKIYLQLQNIGHILAVLPDDSENRIVDIQVQGGSQQTNGGIEVGQS